MNCGKVQRNINAYLDGELDEAASKSITDHVGECAECQAKLEELQAVQQVMKAWSPPGAPHDFVERTVDAASKPYVPSRRAAILRPAAWKKLALAASIVLAIGIGIWFLNTRTGSSFQIRLVEVAYMKEVGALIESTNSLDGLSDVANISHRGTGAGLARAGVASRAARTNVAIGSTMATLRSPDDARLFHKFLTEGLGAQARLPALIPSAWAAELPGEDGPLVEAAKLEYAGQTAAARKIYEDLLGRPGADGAARLRLGFIMLAQGEVEKLEALVNTTTPLAREADYSALQAFLPTFRQAAAMIRLARKEPAYSAERTKLLLSAGAFKPAADDLAKFWREDAEKGFLYGWCLARSGNPELAMEVLDAVIDAYPLDNPARILALFETAALRERLGFYREAARYFALAAKTSRGAGDEFFAMMADLQGVYTRIGEGDMAKAKRAADRIRDEAARKLATELLTR